MSAPKKTTGRTTPKKSQTDSTPTSAAEWKAGAVGAPLKVPSGKTALVRNPGIQAFLTAGLLPNSLMPIVTEALERGKPPSMSAFQEGVKTDPKFLAEMLESLDKVTIYCVVQPQVVAVPLWTRSHYEKDLCSEEQIGTEAPQLKDPRVLYVDEVDLDDKMFIFQWACGGTRDLARFRKEYGVGVADVQRGSDVGGKAKRAG